MSVFASLGQDDIWSISGIDFARYSIELQNFIFFEHQHLMSLLNSPINEILDKEQCSLEELLKEDELFMELKSHNTKLVNL